MKEMFHYHKLWHTATKFLILAVPLHAMEALGGIGGIAPTHSRPQH
jgi:hypothetical protein